MQESILQIPVTHKLVHQQHTASFWVGGESEDGNDERRVELGGQEELVLELALALERARVHDLDSDILAGVGESTEEDGAEAALAEAALRGERIGGAAEDGVGEAVGRLGVGFRGGSLPGDLATANYKEEEKRKGGGRGGGERLKEVTGAEGLGLGSCRGWGLRDLAHLEHQNDVKIETF